jgi:hypothetical protein
MPIRFRCCFCQQLLAIGHRKAATVTTCPNCQGQVWVPDPEHPDIEKPVAEEMTGSIVLLAISDPGTASGGLLWLTQRQIWSLLAALVLALVLLFGVGVYVGRLRGHKEVPPGQAVLVSPGSAVARWR